MSRLSIEVIEIVTVLNPDSKFSLQVSQTSRSLSLSHSHSLSLLTCIPGSRHGSLYLHSSLSGRPHSAIILFRSFSWLSRHALERRLPCSSCLRESEFSGSNYVTRRRAVPDIVLAIRDYVHDFRGETISFIIKSYDINIT